MRSSAGGFASVLFAGHGRAADNPIEVAPPPRTVISAVPANLKPQDTLFLTWQRDPTTTITVQWVGPTKDAPTSVRVVPAPILRAFGWATDTVLSEIEWRSGPVLTKPFGNTEVMVHRCELTGLTPGTEYLLQLGTSTQFHRFRTMPAKATNALQFVSGGDVGTNPASVANNIQAARQDPDFAVIGGDLGYDNGKSVEISLAFLRNYSRHMVGRDGRLIPMIAGIGNHEVAGGYNKKRADAPFFYSLFDGLYPDTGYNTLDFGDYLSLIMLDTGHTSPCDGAQAAWLEMILKSRMDIPM